METKLFWFNMRKGLVITTQDNYTNLINMYKSKHKFLQQIFNESADYFLN